MEELANVPGIKPIELVHAQRVCLHLSITTLANITDSDGVTICDWAMNAMTNPRQPTHRFPRQDKPSPDIISTWRNVIRRCFATSKECILDEPLGLWYAGRISQVWNTVIDPSTAMIYQWQGGRVLTYERLPRSRSRYRYLRRQRESTFPLGSVPISTSFQAGNLIIRGFHKATAPPIASTESEMEMMNMNRGALSRVPLDEVAMAFWDGNAIMGTNGSVRGDVATYSWVVSLQQEAIHVDVKGGGFLPATAQYLDLYSKCTEAAALFAGLTWLYTLLIRFPNPNPDRPTPILPIPVDNEGVVLDVHCTINNQTPTFDLISPDYDILQAIRVTLQALPIRTKIFHVKGHQDNHHDFNDLDIYVKINVLAN